MAEAIPFLLFALCCILFVVDRVLDALGIPLWPHPRGEITAEDAPLQIEGPKVFTDMDRALMNAEWKAFCLSPDFRTLEIAERRIDTPEGSYLAGWRFPKDAWDPETHRMTKPPVDGKLRQERDTGELYVTLTCSEFREQFPDIDPLQILQERLEHNAHLEQLRVAAEEAVGLRASVQG